MTVSNLKDQLKKSIELAHLELDSKEEKTIFNDLENILSFVQLIEKAEKESAVNLGEDIAVQNKEFPQLKKNNVLREDVIEPFTATGEIMTQVPQKKDNLIKVKKV